MFYLQNLKDEMKKRSIREEDLAVVVNRTARTITNWISGQGEPTFSQARIIRDKCFPDMDIEVLFANTGGEPHD